MEKRKVKATALTTEGLHFVVLRHTGVANPHFDLMFEEFEPPHHLITFRSPCWPIHSRTTVVRLADHRRGYLQYEGPISGGRGEVRRVSAGAYTAWPAFYPGEIWGVRMRTPDELSHLLFRRMDTSDGWSVEPVSA